MQQFASRTIVLAVAAAAACAAATAQAQTDESWSLGGNYLPATSRAKVAGTFGGGSAEESSSNLAEIAKKLQNPVSDLEYVNFRFDIDAGLGSDDAIRRTLFIEPVLPFEINADWDLVMKTTLPVIWQDELVKGAGDNHGIGDIEQSFFFTPKAETAGWIWGAGPVISWPTASDDALGSQKYEFGPTAVALQQKEEWTYGVLMNHLWSVPSLGDSDRRGVNATLFQPFLAYTTDRQTTLSANTETIYDWEIDRWTIPVNFVVSQLLDVSGHPINLFAGLRTYLDSPSGGPNWGVRFGVTIVLPKSK
jgi:hypothetical protein